MSASATGVNGSAKTDQLLQQIKTLSGVEKEHLAKQILRDLIGEKPDQEYGMYNDDGSSFVFLVPPRIHVIYQATPERLARLEQSRSNPGKIHLHADVVAELERMQRESERR